MIDFEYFTTRTPFDLDAHLISIGGGVLLIHQTDDGILSYQLDFTHGKTVVIFAFIERYFCIGCLNRKVEFQQVLSCKPDTIYNIVSLQNEAAVVTNLKADGKPQELCRLNEGNIFRFESGLSGQDILLYKSIHFFNKSHRPGRISA